MADANTQYLVKRYKNFLHIYDHIFHCNYYYVYAKNHKEYCKTINKEFHLNIEVDEGKDGCFNAFSKKDTDVGVIWSRGGNVPTIAHECLHAVSYFLRGKGVPLSNDTDEIYAYLFDFLFETIVKAKRR